jgi:type I site-specific restriction-modification system R (restriction) subunit
MSQYQIDQIFLVNESDVEQKVVIPLLTNAEPDGLGYSYIHYQTKNSLKKLNIDKRNSSKVYYPDYVILIEGLPLIVIEVKKLNEDLQEAYREARLYALEINSFYKSNINPCSLIMATDGNRLLAGKWDNNTPAINIEVNEWVMTNVDFGWFVDNFGFKKIKETSEAIQYNTDIYLTQRRKKSEQTLSKMHMSR